MAPATMSVGTAGTGNPIWSSSTLPTTMNSPYCRDERNELLGHVPPLPNMESTT
jgi:hypothetical protein